MNGALLIDKEAGISSFGVIERLQRQFKDQGLKRRDWPKMGHGGTLDPFATGLLPVCAGKAVKLARYFLGADKEYTGTIRFGETTEPGDPTAPVTEKTENLPRDLAQIREMAAKLSAQAYLQTPPMYSAKKKDGRPLYELAREGIEVEREPKLCHLYEFEIYDYADSRARFRLKCSSGTYVRTLAQDLGRMLGGLALLESLARTETAGFRIERAMKVGEVEAAAAQGTPWDELGCWIPFDRLLEGYDRAEATEEEKTALVQGRQNVLFNILRRTSSHPTLQPASANCVAIYHQNQLVAIARKENEAWGLERVFVT